MIGKFTLGNKGVLLTLVLVGFMAGNAWGAARYWVGGATAAWNVTSSWSATSGGASGASVPAAVDDVYFNSGTNVTVTAVPTQSIRQLLITNNTTVALSAAATSTLSINGPGSTNNLVVASGSTLILGNTGLVNLSIITTASQRGDISGTLQVGNGTFTTSSVGTTVVTVTGAITTLAGTSVVTSTTGTLTFAAGGTYNHQRDGGNIPTATWNAASNLNVTGITATLPTFPASTFGNFTWNNASQSVATGGPTAAISVAGALNVTAGNLLTNTSTTFAVTGTANIATGATFTSVSGTRTFNSNLTIDGTLVAGSATYTFAGAARVLSSASNLTFANVAVPGTWTFNRSTEVTAALTGAGGLTMGTSTTLTLGGTSTITTLNVVTNAPTTVIYNGAGGQTIKAIAYHNLEINKPVGQIASTPGSFSIANNLTITSGTFAVTGTAVTIAGNASGIFSMTANGTFSTVRTTTPWFPTGYTSGNISFNNNSTFTYASTTGFTLPLLSTLPISQYPILGIAGSLQKTLAEATPVYGVNVSGTATLADGGFQITGNAAGSVVMGAGTTLLLGSAGTATQFPLNIPDANIALNATSVVNYGSGQAQSVRGGSFNYGSLTISGANTKTAAGSSIGVLGTFSLNATGGTFDLNGLTLNLTGPATYTTGTFSGNGGGIYIYNTAIAAYNFGPTAIEVNELYVFNGAPVATLNSPVNATSFGIDAGANLTLGTNTILGLLNDYTNWGTINASATTARIAMKGTSAQTITIGTYTSSVVGNFEINNAAGVTLTAPLNVTTLILTDGNLTTTGTNILQVNGLTVANVSGGSATSYVNGPMRRLMPSGVSALSLIFPIGKGDYNPFTVNSPVNAGLGVAIQAEVFDAVAGGTDATGFSSGSPAPARYWATSVGGAIANFTGINSFTLRDTDMTIDGGTAIGASTTVAGTYNSYGGTNPNSPATGDITTASTFIAGLGFYKIGEKGSLCGTYTVGTGEDFTSLKQAMDVLNGSIVTCDVFFELTNNYTGGTESFPITVNQLSYAGGPWTVTVRPSSSVTTTRTIAGDPGTGNALINLNGADNFVIDGVPGGSTGSNVVADGRILLRNTRTAATVGPTVLFNNDATDNALKYLQIEGQNITTTSGTIVFGATAPALGNEGNTISYCAIGNRADAPTTFPTIAIYSLGNSTANRGNDDNNITSNHIFNFWNAGTLSHGILLGNYNSTWNISGNSFYQTASRASSGLSLARSAINIATAGLGGDGFVVENNIIGGSQSDGGGTAFTITGSASTSTFAGILLNVNSAISAVPSTVSGNIIRNISFQTSSTATTAPGVFSGIHIGSNGYNVSVTNNQVGDTTGTGSITLTRTASGTSYGISFATGGFVTITGNRIGSFAITNTTTTTQANGFTGIFFTGGNSSTLTRNISNNVIGSRNTANNINLGTSSTTTAQSMYGIFSTSGVGDMTVENNIIANLTNNHTVASTGLVNHGINVTSGLVNISNNKIYNIASVSPSTGTGITAVAAGIIMNSTSVSGHTISGNEIYNVSNTSNGAVTVHGIFSAAATSTKTTINANLIHSLLATSTVSTTTINGILLSAGDYTASNNMIRLGLRVDGTTTAGAAAVINGINEAAGVNDIYHNSVYIGGTFTNTVNSFALFSAVTTGTRNVMNNILVNARVNAGTGRNYAIRFANTTGLTSNYNDLFVTGTGTLLGQVNITNYTTLADWQAGAAEDANSISSDPKFINAAGSAGVDLHIQAPPVSTPIEGTGFGVAVSFDFDGEDRTAFTPTDMGADAGDFEPIDLTPPGFGTFNITGVCNSATSHSFTVAITDASTVNVTSGTAPRVYYKKSGDANDLTGWKFVESTTGSSPFTFNIDFSTLNAGSVSPGDVLQYFVVAQDTAPTPNVGIATGTFTAAPASVALTSGAFPIGGTIKTFTILPCSGTVTVGSTGANYPSLTNAGGLFEAINATTLTGPLVANITTDLIAETGTHPLNQWLESGVGGYTLTIQADAATQRLIASTSAATTGLIRITGGDRTTFNGGTLTDRLLVFRNTITNNSGASTFSFSSDASNNTINNCIIEGAAISTANGVISFGTGVATGNDNNIITNCDISDNGTTPYNAIYSVGTGTTAINNSGNNINNCNISDYHHPSGVSTGILLGTGNNSWTIENNHFFQSASRAAAAGIHSAININNNVANQGGYVITGNFIGGNAADGSGTMTYTSTLAAQYAPIYLPFVPAAPASTVTNNIIDHISVSTISASTSGPGVFTAIYMGATTAPWTVTGNLIGDTTVNASISVTLNTNAGGHVNGIKIEGTGTSNISNNKISGVSAIGGTGTNVTIHNYGINVTTGNVTADNNLIGSAAVANSLQATSAAASNGSIVGGIVSVNGAAFTGTYTNNRILNLTNSIGTTSSQVVGIITSGGGQFTITGNTIATLNSNGSGTSGATSSSVLGISVNSSNPVHTISNNTLYGLSCNSSTGANATGIYYSGGTGSSVVSRNFVHSIKGANSTTGIVTGISLASAPVTAINNMVRLGIDANGADLTISQQITGIVASNTSGATAVYFNTVYIGGSGVGTTTSNSMAFRTFASTGSFNIRNNILVNTRSNATTGGRHYAYFLGNTTNVTSDYNLFYAPGTGGTLFTVNNGTTPLTTINALRLTSGAQNVNSGVDDPNLVDPTGNAADVDLHITGVTAADEAGIAISGINVDFDGDDRTDIATTPTDIGADATDATPKDIVPPAVSVTSVPAQASCGGTLTVNITATVTDATSGVNTTTFPPTLWWRESTGSWASLAATSNTGNDWLFTLNLTGVTSGQTYQYYAAAQDLATTPNIGYSNYSATTPVHANTTGAPSLDNTAPASFNIVAAAPLFGTVTVGSGGNYTSFNAFNSTGLFFDLMNRGLSGNLIVKVISDVNENGLYNVLGSIPEYCGSGYSVTITPDSNLVRTISQSAGGNPMINFQGCQRIYIDGSFGGSGRYLTFAGRQSMPTFYINGNTQNVSIANCTIEGNNQLTNSVGPGVINFAGLLGSGTLITNITINNNIIRNRSDLSQTAANSPNTLINMGGLSATSLPLKSNITISNNEMFNFRENAINIRQNSSFNGIGDNIAITGNKIYEAINYSLYQYVIWLEGGGNSKGHTISNNIIGGNALPSPGLTGTWNNNKADSEIWAIYTLNGGTNINDGVTISGNTIGNMNLNGYGYGNFLGIRNEFGYAKIENNIINGIANYGHGAAEADASVCIGIWNGDENETEIVGNVVSNIRAFYDVASGFLPFQAVLGIMHGSNFYLNAVDFTNYPGGKIKLNNNQVFNLSSGSLNATIGTPDALTGIFCFPANGTTGNEVSGNQVYNLNCTEGWTNNANNTRIYGIGVGLGGYGATATGVVSNNEVYDMSNNSRANAPEVNGIVAAGGNWTLANNMISITNSDYPNGRPLIVGLLDWMRSGRTGAFYNNSVYIGGTVVGGSNSSYAYCRIPDATASVNGAAVTIRNNIFFNDRTGNSTNNIAIGNLGTLNTPSVGWNSDYNFLLTRNTGQVGRWIGTTAGDRTFAGWQTTSGGDANSKTATITTGTSSSTAANPAELFLNTATGDLHISITPPNDPWPYSHVQNFGETLAALTVDIDGDARPLGAAYDMGADEFTSCATPVVTGNPISPTICSGASTSVSLSATGSGLTYAWEVNTGSSWAPVSNGGVYSTAGTTTLNITAAPASMTGYQYRGIVSNTCGNDTTLAGTLTVNEAGAVTVSGGGTFCGSATLTATGGTGGTIYWQNTTSGGTSNTTASSSQSVTSSGTYYFRAQTSGACWGAEGSATVTILAAPNAATTWTGTVDSDWFKWDNWTNCVPGSITDVTIPSGAPNYPSVYGSNPVANSVTIQSGGAVTLNGGRTLITTDYINNQGTLTMSAASTIRLSGNWTNTGTFNSGNGTVEFTGASNSTVNAGGTGTTQAFNNILVTKTGSAKVTLAASVKTNGNLQVNTGEFEVPAGLQALPTNVINNPSGTIRVKGTGQLRVEP